MRKTKIQWCHSTVNPVMGCDGCELWTGANPLQSEIESKLESEAESDSFRIDVSTAFGSRAMSQIYRDREMVASQIAGGNKRSSKVIVDVVRRRSKCYAGLLGTLRAGHKGYADQFEKPKRYPGRMEKASRWSGPSEDETAAKPWLIDCPRLIFVSDMGDALSTDIAFEYLREEVIEKVSSPSGRQHIWLWLTKRPGRMAQFGEWLKQLGTDWPDNLMAMTTVTTQTKSGRIDELRKVPSRLRGLSLEPLFGPVDLDLSNIDWVIVGGGSDVLAEPFHVEWALTLKEQCAARGIAFFLKQLGKRPFYDGQPISLVNKHGGDWNEWNRDWRIREVPEAFRRYKAVLSLG